MDHSVYGYLKRQETYTLELMLDNYMNMETTQVNKQIVAMIKDVLSERNAMNCYTNDDGSC